MVNYRRALVPGGSYFFTVALHDRNADTLVRHAVDLRQAFRMARFKQPWRTEAIVIMPDHLHAL